MRGSTGLALLCLVAACAEPEVHLIPAGFEGPVIIIFNDPNGAPMRREGRARRSARRPGTGLLGRHPHQWQWHVKSAVRRLRRQSSCQSTHDVRSRTAPCRLDVVRKQCLRPAA
jgi:hypothetical protein